MSEYKSLTPDNLNEEHLCCAIGDKKHQAGVDKKRAWLRERLPEGHVFRKLDERGKIFIEYAPLETAWVSAEGDNYLYIYCFWVSGSFKGKGHGRVLLDACVADAKERGKSGVCAMSAKKKKPFLSDGKYLKNYGFEVADTAPGDYELLALSFDGTLPRFTEGAKKQAVDGEALTIYYSAQCPCIPNCIEQVESYCKEKGIPCDLIPVNTLEEAEAVPGIFNNWAVFNRGKFETVHLLNEGYLKKMFGL